MARFGNAEHKQNMLSLSDASTASPAALPHEHGVALLYEAFLIGYEAVLRSIAV